MSLRRKASTLQRKTAQRCRTCDEVHRPVTAERFPNKPRRHTSNVSKWPVPSISGLIDRASEGSAHWTECQLRNRPPVPVGNKLQFRDLLSCATPPMARSRNGPGAPRAGADFALICNGFHRSLPTRVARADGPRSQGPSDRCSDQLRAIVSFARWLSWLHARYVILLRGYAGRNEAGRYNDSRPCQWSRNDSSICIAAPQMRSVNC